MSIQVSKFTMSVDDGCASDVRVAELAKKYGVECVFYIPVEWNSLAYDKGYEPLSYEQAQSIAEEFEIGSHTITHRHLTSLTYDEAYKEIVYSKDLLENMFDTHVYKFCPPRGYTNEDLTELTYKHYDSQRLTKGEGLVHVHLNSGANGNVPWREYADSIEVKEIWMHSWELDKYDLWKELEEYLSDSSS